MDITFAIDISHHQPLSLDLAQTRRDGCELAILKAGEGDSFVDPDFASNLAEARAAGQLVAAYWYQRVSASAAAHVSKIKQVVPRDVAVIPDVEANSGGVNLTRAIVSGLLAEGYHVPFTYLPRWYWQQIGSPSLAGLPPLWSSRYPDTVVGLLAAEWAQVPARYWEGYGGLEVGLLQFTSSARIAGYAPLDASAFRGTRAQLAAVLGQTSSGGSTPSGPTTTTGVELMERITVTPPDAEQHAVRVFLSGSAGAAVIVRPRLGKDGFSKPMWVGDIFAWGNDRQGVGHNPTQTPGYDNRLTSHRRYDLPGAVWADINYSSADPFEIDIVG
jgi:hypothetical protein